MANKIQFSDSSGELRLEIGTNDVALEAVAANDLLTNLISCWELDETSGTVVYDAHASNNGTNNGPAAINQTGIINKAYTFNGGSDYLGMGNILNFGSSEDWTVSIWLKGHDNILHTAWNKRQASSPNQGLWLYYENRTIYTDSSGAERDYSYTLFIDVGATTYNICTGKDSVAADDTGWHLVTSFRSGTTLGIALDDNTPLTYTNAGVSASLSSTNSFYIATRRLADLHWAGTIDQTAAWSRALTPDDISDLYNSGSGLAYTSWE